MLTRLLRALSAIFNVYSFYTNPVKFIVTLLVALILPYLAYILLGGVVFIIVLVLGIYLMYRTITYKEG